MSQSHPSTVWREPAGSGAVPSVLLGKLVNAPPRMAFEWNWGDALPNGLVFTGDANRTKIDAAGVVRTVAANVPRDDGYVYDKNGVLQPAWLLEAGSTNRILYSEQFDNAAWSAASTSVTANATTAPDGNATADQIADTSAVALGEHYQTRVIPNDSSPYTFSIWIKKSTSSIVGIGLDLFGGTAVSVGVVVNLNTGALINSTVFTTVPTRSLVAAFPNGWYRISITISNNASGNTAVQAQIYPAWASVQQDSYDPAATGSIYAWGAQLESSSTATSYIPTGAAAVTRGTEIASLPWGFAPAAMVMYAKFLEVGGSLLASSGLVSIGDATNFCILWAPTPGYEADYSFFETGQLAAPAIGDQVELRAVLTAAGGISAGQSLNGAAETTKPNVAGSALPAAWHLPRLSLCGPAGLVNPGVAAFESIRLALGGPWSLDQMRKVANDPNRLTVATAGAAAASLVSRTGGYSASTTDLTGSGKIAVIGPTSKGKLY